MGKKARLYLLAVVNFIAWGYVGYKVYSALQGDDDPEFNATQTSLKKIEPELKDNDVVLQLNYSDPFLKNGNFSGEHHVSVNSGGNHSTKPKAISNSVTKPVNTIITQAPLDIKYLGLVKNNEKGTQTAMLSVNGKSQFVKPNDVIEGFIIKTIYRDSITAQKGKKERLTIKK